MSSSLILYPTVGGFAGTDPTGLSMYGNSLGGYRAQNPLLKEKFLPILESLPRFDVFPHVYRLFHDLENSELAGGKTDYRALVIRNEGTTTATAPSLYFDQPAIGVVSLFIPTPNADGSVQRISDEKTAPAGASWSTPTSGGPTTLSDIPVGGQLIIWLKRAISGGFGATPWDFFTIHVAPSGESETVFRFFHTLKSTATQVTITGTKDINALDMSGDVFTIATTDSSLAAADPAGNQVNVLCSAATYNPRFFGNVDPSTQPGHLRGDAGTFIDRALKTATGTYRWNFKPPMPGHWFIVVDAGGGELSTQLHIEVTPVPL